MGTLELMDFVPVGITVRDVEGRDVDLRSLAAERPVFAGFLRHFG